MINFIKTLFQLYKIITFTKTGDLIIAFNGSKIKFTKEGDLIINAKRHTIHHRDLFFDGCDNEFIDKAIKANNESKKQLETFVMSNNRASEFTCNLPSKQKSNKNS